MAKEMQHIPFDEFARRLPAIFDVVAQEQSGVVVEREGKLYRLEPQVAAVHQLPQDGIWAGYDPQRMRNALIKSAGALAGIDRDELLRDLYEQREQDSQGRPA